MADSLRDGGILDLTKEGSACLRAMTFFLLLLFSPSYVNGLKITSTSVSLFRFLRFNSFVQEDETRLPAPAGRRRRLFLFLLCQLPGD